jgi:acyl-coenzyme A thioesterase PaaI-like protein
MTAAVFDDVMGYVNVIDGVAAYTLELQVRYVAGMPLHTPVEVRARTVEVTERRSTVTAEARVVADGEARAVFALIPAHRL